MSASSQRRQTPRHRMLMASLLLVLASTTLLGDAWARGDETTRTPPYDFGCLLGEGSICIPWEEARNGTLRGGRVPAIGAYGIPPTAYLSYLDYSSAAGIHLDLTARAWIRLSAVVRKADLVEAPPELHVRACLGLVASGLRQWSCRRLSGLEPIQLTYEPSLNGAFTPGRWRFVVYLTGDDGPIAGPSEVKVESISYEDIPTRLLRVDRAGTGDGWVRSSPGGIVCSGPGGWYCSRAYPLGTEVVLTASPTPGSSFDGWKDCEQPDGDECTQVIGPSDETVTATFRRD